MFIARINENVDIVVVKCHHILLCIMGMPLYPPTYVVTKWFSYTEDFSFNFYVTYCIFKGYVYTHRYMYFAR